MFIDIKYEYDLFTIQVCDIVRQGAQVFWIEEQQVPFAVLGDQWISFDDAYSLINKVRCCTTYWSIHTPCNLLNCYITGLMLGL